MLFQKAPGNLHRLACDTHAPLYKENEPSLTFAHMPLPKSSKARLSPSIWVNSNLRVGFTIPMYPKCSCLLPILHSKHSPRDFINSRNRQQSATINVKQESGRRERSAARSAVCLLLSLLSTCGCGWMLKLQRGTPARAPGTINYLLGTGRVTFTDTR